MSEYVVTPESNQRPSGTTLMEELHRRGFPVEIHLKGTPQLWESLRFSEPGPPEVECFLTYNAPNRTYTVSVPHDSTQESRDLLMHAVDALMGQVGGRADNSSTRERFTAEEFRAQLKIHLAVSQGHGELVWVVFAWAVVGLGLAACFAVSPGLRALAVIALALSLLSAAGLTYARYKS